MECGSFPVRSPTFARVSQTNEVASARADRDTCGNVIKPAGHFFLFQMRWCLLTPLSARTQPKGTLSLLSLNVTNLMIVTSYDCHFSSSRRELALGADGGCLVLSWSHSKSAPCLLVRHKHRHTNHHAATSLAFKFAPAPLGVTHDTSATRPATSTTAPPCPSPTRRTTRARGGTRNRARGGFRISGRRRRVVVGGALRSYRNKPKCRDKSKTKRALPRTATRGVPERSESGD